MTIQSEITRKDYSRLMTAHLLKTPFLIFISIMGLAFVIFYFMNPELGQFYLFLGIGFAGLPVLTFFTIGQGYDRNKHFNEKVDFILGQNNLELVGQTFRSSFTWDQISKVKESGEFFSFYQGRVLLMVINKKFTNEETVGDLRQFFKNLNKI